MNLQPPRRAHVQRAREALDDIARGTQPADQRLDTLFRSHKQMGKRDRAAVSDMVYGVLRDICRLRALAGDEPAVWLARHLADLGLDGVALTALDLPPAPADQPVSIAATRNLPEDWHAALREQFDDAEVSALAAALNQPAPVDVRVNALKTSHGAALARLAEAGIAATATPHSPWGLRLAKRLSRESPLLLEGELEPQDEGSQLLSLAVAAQSGETVIDYCAGAGGKSLAMAMAMQNRGRIIACDIHAGRLARLPPRARRAGIGIIETQPLTPAPPALPLADAVLVDAPCSGTGTLRRNPELRLRPMDWPALAAQQLAILQQAAAFVRPGGRLIYATCSLMAAENDAVVAAFLSAQPRYRPYPLALDLAARDGCLRLLPHRHGTDGFFAANLRRVD